MQSGQIVTVALEGVLESPSSLLQVIKNFQCSLFQWAAVLSLSVSLFLSFFMLFSCPLDQQVIVGSARQKGELHCLHFDVAPSVNSKVIAIASSSLMHSDVACCNDNGKFPLKAVLFCNYFFQRKKTLCQNWIGEEAFNFMFAYCVPIFSGLFMRLFEREAERIFVKGQTGSDNWGF